jgi:2-hydroxychromene-2-carboxylate isomerase
MKHMATTAITMYLDFISPYAYLAFETLPQHLQGLDVSVRYEPILFAGLLKHHGQLGPAEIDSKREWTYRQVLWLAREAGVPLELPASHPFNPLALLRLSRACSTSGQVDRATCAALFRHVWCHPGEAADDPQRLDDLIQVLKPARSITDPEVKQALIEATQRAIEEGVFGVPTFAVHDRLFWGQDSLPMLRQYLQGDVWFETARQRVASVAQGVKRSIGGA